MNNNFQNDIQNVNQIFNDVLTNYKSNYVNYHTNQTLSLSASTGSTTNVKSKDPNDDALLKYRYAANYLLEKVRSQINTNSKQISTINTNITPIQKQYLQIMETGTALHQTKLAAVVSLEDYNELYKTTVFGTLMYAVGAGCILYLMYKPKIQSQSY